VRGFTPLGRILALAMIVAGLGTATLATAEAARAAEADLPTAIGVSSGGTTYVGFASGGRLQRISASGRSKSSIELDRDEAVDGIFVTDRDDIWVDYETGMSLLSPSGRLIARHDHDPVRACDSSAPAHRYGGITATGDRIFVANRCDDSFSVYARDGELLATVDLPGADHPRGITYGGAQAGRPATLYVAIPDRGQILSYRASSLRSSSTPSATVTLKRPTGGVRPEPGGIAVDKWGQLAVTDIANHAVYLLDTNHDFSLYRTLGHPPRASRAAGRLNGPAALAQHDQDGGSMSGDLFIADTGNSRAQRWNTSGYTYWAKGVRPGSGGGGGGGGGAEAPESTAPPEVAGTAQVGWQLTCDPGTWTGHPSTFEYAWSRDGAAVDGATGSTYRLTGADAGAQVACRVRATNARGTSAWATSDPVRVGGSGGGGTGPTNLSPPVISGTPAVGQTVSCSPGSWSGGGPGSGLTYAFQWLRGGTPIAGATSSTYLLVATDSGTSLTCVVTATTNAGSTQQSSAAVVVSGAGSTGPANTLPPIVSGAPRVGETLTCLPGAWTGSGVGYAYVWKRDGTAIALATWAGYTVLSEDADTTVTCTVTATNGQGSAQATSAGVRISAPSGHAPANVTAPAVSGTPAVGQTLTCDPGTWTGIPELVTTYAWQRDGADVVGAAAATYAVTAADAGTSLRCVVVVANGYGRAAAASPGVSVAGGGGGSGCGTQVGVTVEAGATRVTSPNVQLGIVAPSGVTAVTISNDPDFATSVTFPVTPTCTYAWTLRSTPGAATRSSVFVRFGTSPVFYGYSVLVDRTGG